jgi:type VI secretion system secreted protein VgrG
MSSRPLPLHRRLAGGALALLLASGITAQAQTAPSLGQAGSFAVLGGSAVSNTGGTVITGDLGIWPNTASSITGFPPGVIIGTTHAGDAVALQAQSDLTTAYNDLAGRACNTELTGTDLGGLTLTPGVYCFATSAQLTGTLTLDAQGNANAIFIFQVGSTLTTASNASVAMVNAGNDCNVYWQVGSSATIGTGSDIAGNILALSSITVTTGSSLSGRALARNGAVTLDTNTVAVCAGCPVISLSPASLPNGTLGAAYSQAITASGGSSPYDYSVLSGALPPGLLLNPATGELAGTPTQPGSFTFTVGASDALSCPGSRTYTIVINAPQCPVISLLPETLPSPSPGVAYSQSVTASGGQAPYAYTVTSGALPSGLLLNSSSGEISGVTLALGVFSYAITATDANGCLTARVYSGLIVAPMCPVLAVSPQQLPVLVIGQPFLQVIAGSGGTAPYTYQVTSGQLPAGFSLNSQSGLLSGVPQTIGNFSFVVTITDAMGCQVLIDYQASAVAGSAPTMIPSLSLWGLLGLLAGVSALALFSLALRRS